MPPKQVQFYLCPTPGAKPEFLATIESTTSTSLDSSLPERIVLENYTRDAWATKPNPSVWQKYTVKSVDGRQKLPGFLKYLKDRQKSAYGRFANKASVIVVPAVQKGAPATMDILLSWDIAAISNGPLGGAKPVPGQVKVASAPQKPAPTQRKGGMGLLGKLVSSQQRTNAHVQKANAKPIRPPAPAPAPKTKDGDDDDDDDDDDAAPPPPTKTAQEVISSFRNQMEEKLLDFDIAPDTVIKIPIALSQHTRGLVPEDLPKVTMEILKYIVYEQAEEINEEWVAHKEPSEFLDEIVIAVYKEGEAPPEVLEEMNQGELPDEVKGQMAHGQQQKQKSAELKDNARAQELARKALAERAAEDGDDSALNQNKRDRRSIEEIQRENKRARMDP